MRGVREVADMQHYGPTIEQVSVRSLKPYPRNARRHSKDQIKQIAASIKRFGFNNPILIADDGEIVAGHGRLAAAQLLDLETVPTLASVSSHRSRTARLCDRG
jgi:hypothetical protein